MKNHVYPTSAHSEDAAGRSCYVDNEDGGRPQAMTSPANGTTYKDRTCCIEGLHSAGILYEESAQLDHLHCKVSIMHKGTNAACYEAHILSESYIQVNNTTQSL